MITFVHLVSPVLAALLPLTSAHPLKPISEPLDHTAISELLSENFDLPTFVPKVSARPIDTVTQQANTARPIDTISQKANIVLNSFFHFFTTPSITFRNLSPEPICYKVEWGLGNLTTATNTTCDMSPGFLVPANTSRSVNVTRDFSGAFTAMLHNDTLKGTRHEFNYVTSTNLTWYDVDYELGISNSTLGPLNHHNNTNNIPSLTGEKNVVSKVNDAWRNLTSVDQVQLLSHNISSYMQATPAGNVTSLKLDKQVPFELIEFLQLKANLSGYVHHGSVDGIFLAKDSREGIIKVLADAKTQAVTYGAMEITAY